MVPLLTNLQTRPGFHDCGGSLKLFMVAGAVWSVAAQAWWLNSLTPSKPQSACTRSPEHCIYFSTLDTGHWTLQTARLFLNIANPRMNTACMHCCLRHKAHWTLLHWTIIVSHYSTIHWTLDIARHFNNDVQCPVSSILFSAIVLIAKKKGS